MNFRLPGALCQELGAFTHIVKDGTMARSVTPKPGAVGTSPSRSGHLLKDLVQLVCPPAGDAATTNAPAGQKTGKTNTDKEKKEKEAPPPAPTSHVLTSAATHIGKAYPNDKGEHQCAAFAQAASVAGAPQTKHWRRGDHVEPGKPILKGTWVATFVNDRYQGHVGVFDSMNDKGDLTLIDQWIPRNRVDRTTYHVKTKPPDKISNDPTKYYIVLW